MKSSNEYAEAFGRLYAKTPKSVFAAVAFSYANWACGDESGSNEQTISRFLHEWKTLNENGIVPQRAPKGEKPSLSVGRSYEEKSA